MQPDDFPIEPNDPHVEAHRLLGRLLKEVSRRVADRDETLHFENYASGRTLLKGGPEFQGSCFLAAHERYFWNIKRHTHADSINNTIRSHACMCFQIIPRTLFYMPLEFNERDILLLVQEVAGPNFDRWHWLTPRAFDFLEHHIATHGLSDSLRALLTQWSEGIRPDRDRAKARKIVWRVDCLIGRAALGHLEPGEPWADVALNDIETLHSSAREKWHTLLVHAHSCDASRPSPRWLQHARALVGELGETLFLNSVRRWFTLAAEQPVSMYNDRNAMLLKGLVWACLCCPSDAPLQSLTQLALASFRKVPEKSALAYPLGNACIYVLSNMPGREALDCLKQLQAQLKNRSVLTRITNAISSSEQHIANR